MARFKNVDWDIKTAEGDKHAASSVHEAHLAVLMDLRDELKKLNAVFACPNALAIPNLLRRIARNTTRKKRVKK